MLWIKNLITWVSSSQLPWSKIILVFLGALLIWYVRYLETSNSELSSSLQQAVQTANVNAAAVQDIKKQSDKDLAAVVADRNRWEAEVQSFNKAREEIKNAPSEDDAAVAPVLVHTIDGLRAQSNPTSAGGKRKTSH